MIALVAFLSLLVGILVGIVVDGFILGRIVAAVEGELHRQRTARVRDWKFRPQERLKPGSMSDRDPAETIEERRRQHEEEREALLEAGRVVRAEREA